MQNIQQDLQKKPLELINEVNETAKHKSNTQKPLLLPYTSNNQLETYINNNIPKQETGGSDERCKRHQNHQTSLKDFEKPT